jgi:SAM-dependent methyltransferase
MIMKNGDYDAFASFYDLEYGHKENDLDFYLDMAEQYGSPILEIGVGTGRVAFDLAWHGYEVHGIDNSKEMLLIAEEHAGQQEAAVRSRLQLTRAAMQDFNLEQQFPLCIIPFRAFLHNLNMDEQLTTLSNIKKHLLPSGILAFDLFVPLYNVMAQKIWHDRIDQDDLAEADSGIFIDVNIEHKAAEQLLTIENIYHDKIKNTRQSAIMQYRYIFRYEMEALLRHSGFRIMNVFGGFEKQPYDYHSGIMVFVAQRES